MDKDIVVIGPEPKVIGIVNALGLTGQAIQYYNPLFASGCPDFEGDSMVLSPRTLIERLKPRGTGVAKDRRVARKKRAKKLARRR